MKLKCFEHNVRVMTFDGKVIHRTDGSHCTGSDMQIGEAHWRTTHLGLMEIIKTAKGRERETPVAHMQEARESLNARRKDLEQVLIDYDNIDRDWDRPVTME